MRRRLQLIVVAVLAALAAAVPAWADVHITRGETVNELRVIGQDVRVDGQVHGPVLVVAGNLRVGASGRVANVTVIGGRIESAPGAQLRGDVFQVGGSLPDLTGWRLALVLLGLLALRTLLAWLVVRGADAVARTRLLPPLSRRLRDAPGRTLLTGTLGALGLLALSVLAALTLVGLPVALVLWGLLLLALVAGIAVAQQAIATQGEHSRGVLVALAIPLVGDALLALALAVGLGALLRWLGAPSTPVEVAGASRSA
jgi:hypothetical protein